MLGCRGRTGAAAPFLALTGIVLVAGCASGSRPLRTSLQPPAYVVAEINVTKLSEYRTYASAAFPIIGKYGGRFLARGGTVVPVEGAAPVGRVMIIAFPSLAQAKAFEDSPEYNAIVPLRRSSAESRLFIVQGSADAAASAP